MNQTYSSALRNIRIFAVLVVLHFFASSGFAAATPASGSFPRPLESYEDAALSVEPN